MSKFSLGDDVEIGKTGIVGEVIGVAEYLYSRTLNLVAYCDKDGVPKEEWYNDTELFPDKNSDKW